MAILCQLITKNVAICNKSETANTYWCVSKYGTNNGIATKGVANNVIQKQKWPHNLSLKHDANRSQLCITMLEVPVTLDCQWPPKTVVDLLYSINVCMLTCGGTI